MSKGVSTWAGFLALAFGVLGLLAGFTTYAVPVPLERALQRGLVLDEVLAASRAGADLSAFRATLGDSADAVLGGTAPIAERVAAERAAMGARFQAEAAGLGRRLRLMILVVTAMCMGFGIVAIFLAAPRAAKSSPSSPAVKR